MKMLRWWMVLLFCGLLVVGGCSCESEEGDSANTVSGDPTASSSGDGVSLQGSDNFVVTSCEETDDGGYAVTINNRLLVRHIEVKGDDVDMPHYQKDAGSRRYDYLEVYGPDAETLLEDIEQAVLAVADDNEIEENDDDFDELKISGVEVRIVPRDSGDDLIFASFVVNDDLKIGSFRVLKSRNGGYRVVPPSQRIGGKHVPSIECVEDIDQETINEEILKAFAVEAGLDPDEIAAGASNSSGSSSGPPPGTKPVDDIYISKIEEVDGSYTATLWGGITVSGIEIKDGDVVLPASVNSQNNRRYEFIKPPYQGVADAVEALKTAVEAFAENGDFEGGTQEDAKVTTVFISGLNDRGAWGNVTLNNSIQICSFKISERNGSIRIYKPSLKVGDEFVNVVEIPDALWEEIQEKIEDAYRAKKRSSNN